MKRYFISILIVCAAFAQACNEKVDVDSGKTSDQEILVNRIEIADPATKSGGILVSEPVVIEGSDFSFTVTESVSPMGYEGTKATEFTGLTTDDSLVANGFTVDGYYKTINGDDWNKFITAQDTEYHSTSDCDEGYESPYWCFKSPIFWKERSYHYFWAYAPSTNVSNFVGNPKTEVATFSYTSDFSHDLVMAHNGKLWDYTHTNSHTGDKLDLVFDHALAGVKINYEIETKAVIEIDSKGDPKKIAPEQGRISITGFNVIAQNKGVCTINKDNSFSWEINKQETSSSKAHSMTETEEFIPEKKDVLHGVSNGPDFVIPQNTPESIALTIFDAKKQLTYPKFIPLKNDFGKTNNNNVWESGDMYTYNFTGSITASYKPGDSPGIDFDFDGHKESDELLITSLQGKYMKTIEICWDGIPVGNGNSESQAYVVLTTTDKKTLTAGKDGDIPEHAQDLTTTNYPEIVFAASIASDRKVVTILAGRGQCEEYKDKDGNTVEFKDSYCTTGPIELPAEILGKDFNLFVGYWGANGSGNPVWHATNFTIKVIEYY